MSTTTRTTRSNARTPAVRYAIHSEEYPLFPPVTMLIKLFLLTVLLLTLVLLLFNLYPIWNGETNRFSKVDKVVPIHVEEKKDVTANSKNIQLPFGQAPIKYELTLTLRIRGYGDAKKSKAHGKIRIHFTNQLDGKREIELHAVGLTLHTASLFSRDNKLIEHITNATSYDDLERVKFHTTNSLNQSLYILEVTYDLPVYHDNSGLYETAHRNSNGSWVFGLATNNKPIYMRRIAPCFDEPIYRAQWSLTCTHPKEVQAFSNAMKQPTEDDRIIKGFTMTRFVNSIAIPPHAFGLVVGDYAAIEQYSDRGIRTELIFINSTARSADALRASISVAAKLVDDFAANLITPYPQDKLALVSLPDFSGRFSESMGLVELRDSYLSGHTSPSRLDNDDDYKAIAEATAHMWFGNLVSAWSWTGGYIPDGLAALYAGMKTRELTNNKHPARVCPVEELLEEDSDHVRPSVERSLDSNVDIVDQGNRFVHGKACAIFEMFQQGMGEKKWTNGIVEFLHKNEWKAPQRETFFDALVAAGSIPTAAEMGAWMDTTGYPLVIVSYNGKEITLKQSIFDVMNRDAFTKNRTLAIPIHYSSRTEKGFFVFEKPTLSMIDIGAPETFFIDTTRGGYYRVIYQVDMYETHLRTYDDRDDIVSSLILDALAGARAGYLKLRDVVVIVASANKWPYLFDHFEKDVKGTRHEEAFKRLRNMYTRSGRKLSIREAKKELERDAEVLHRQCSSNTTAVSECFTTTANRAAVFCEAAKGGNFDFIFSKFKLETHIDDRNTLFNALFCSDDAKHYESILNNALNDKDDAALGVRYQDIPAILREIAQRNATFVANYMLHTLPPILSKSRDHRLLLHFFDHIDLYNAENARTIATFEREQPHIAHKYAKQLAQLKSRATNIETGRASVEQQIQLLISILS